MNENNKKLDVIHPRHYTNAAGEDKVDWLRCGVAFESSSGIDVILYCMPMTRDKKGEVRLLLKPADPKPTGQRPEAEVMRRRVP
jgi:hypothetical protein